MALTYSTYLKLDELLELQQPRSARPEHDETLFIIVHQTYELWFKQVLHELDHLGRLLDRDDLPRAQKTLGRVLAIFRTLVGQVDILETMTPTEFLGFRDRLETASGFQSVQFRELELLLGLKSRSVFSLFPRGTAARDRLERRMLEPSLWARFLHFLSRRGHPIPPDVLERDVTSAVEASPEVQRALVDVYRTDPAIELCCEQLIDLDAGLQEWRYRHVAMVERTIGGKPGTGQSAGVEYLKKTLFRKAFPDLWAIRTSL